MREFKEFPCTVYMVSHTLRITKVTVNREQYRGSKSSGYSNSAGMVYARNCYPTPTAAIKGARSDLAKKAKRIAMMQADLAKGTAKVDQQEQAFLQKAKKK